MSLSQLKWWACALSLVTAGALGAQAQGNAFNTPGNILISDQYNNRVVEVNPNNHKIVWHFGNQSSTPGLHSVVAPNDAQRIGPFTLIAGTGAPQGAEPTCMGANGCQDNRVFIVDPLGNIIWQYGQAGVAGSGWNQLSTPVQNTWLPDFHVLITDQANERVIEVDLDKNIVWQYGQTGVAGHLHNQLNNPNSAELLENGHILIADENNNRVLEVNRQHNTVWQYGCASCSELSGAAFASRLPNGNTLITDSGNNRVLIVTPEKNVVFNYSTNTRTGSVSSPLPTRAVQLHNGNILISDQYNMQVIEIDKDMNIVWSQGTVGVSGNTFDMLNGPYDAKVVGDYTGLTPPFDFDVK